MNSPKHFKQQMDSQPTETFSVEQQHHVLGRGRAETARWVLNSPDPPGLLHDLINTIKGTLLPHGNKSPSSPTKQSLQKRAFLFLERLFPILNWGRNYKASKFKNDLMAGLTLASLSIPQVHMLHAYKFTYLIISATDSDFVE